MGLKSTPIKTGYETYPRTTEEFLGQFAGHYVVILSQPGAGPTCTFASPTTDIVKVEGICKKLRDRSPADSQRNFFVRKVSSLNDELLSDCIFKHGHLCG